MSALEPVPELEQLQHLFGVAGAADEAEFYT